MELVFDPESGGWSGTIGLRQAGEKQVTRVEAVLSDGTIADVTADLVDEFGFEQFEVRFPQEDTFGDCP